MILKRLTLTNFRNFPDVTFYFNPLLTIVKGKNAVGKTNLLEAIYFLTHGRGLREEKQEDFVTFGKSRCRVEGECRDGDDKVLLRIMLERDGVIKKKFLVNKLQKKLHAYTDLAPPTVIFTPQLIRVIDGKPSRRRRFLDAMLTRVDIEYKKRLTNYENALKKRNKILERVREVARLKQELFFWDEYLVEQADYIAKQRARLVDFLNQGKRLDDQEFTCTYRQNVISHQTLADTFDKQLILKRTLVGPQRDDFEISKDGRNVHTFASRSEQRLALFWLLVNQIRLFQKKLKHRPIVLLDDIFSELDLSNRALITHLIKKYQTVLTTAEPAVSDVVDIPNTVIPL